MIKRITAALALAFALTGIAATPATAAELTPWKCAAYVLKGTQTSLCATFPGDADRDCKQIGKPVALVKKGTDPWLLDRDGDGFGCDGGPKPSGSASPSASASASASPSASASSSASPSASVSTPGSTPATTPPTTEPDTVPPTAGGPELPLTGPSGWVLGGVGLMAVLVGGVAWMAARRRTRFEA